MTEYTAEDFKGVRFAHHPKYGVAMRTKCVGPFPWKLEGDNQSNDMGLAETGWVPVREAKPITESELQAAYQRAANPVPLPGEGFNRRFARELGIEIVPDPEPTEAERLTDVIRSCGWPGIPSDKLAYCLLDHGVKLGADDE